ncbi:MAG: EFR1 family ferrodoxin [Clostridiales bacterium]|nr:EFR1 family ferrodoxin [Clostridiales bacterium]
MILYYTGTGNSEYVAKRIAEAVHDEYRNLFDRLQKKDISPIHSEKPFVIVTPTYGWQIPHLLRDWLKQVSLTGSEDIYFVMTCGGEIGNAAKYLIRLCRQIGMNYKGCGEIIMPENYIALFDAPDETEARRIISRADPIIKQIAKIIGEGKDIPDKKTGVIDKMKSSIVNPVYYPTVIHAKKFYATKACVGCGKCVEVCVMNNIRLDDGKPKWDDHCTHCMACICGCPLKAIEYGNASKGKPRYQCPEK